MDNVRFDHLTRWLAKRIDRRTAVRSVDAGMLAAIGTVVGVRAGATAPFDADACVPNGVRCGKKGQAKCRKCCSRYTRRQRKTRQRRCTCRATFKPCRRHDQCCSGMCYRVPCAEGLDPRKKYCIPGFLGPDPCREA